MNPIRKIIDNIKPKVLGKMPFMTSTFEAFETFFFVPKDVTENGSHIRDAIDMKRTMIIVVFALIPCLLFGMYNVGYQHFNSMGVLAETGFWTVFWYGFLKVFWLLLVSYLVGLSIEFAFAQVRKHKVNEGFLVTGMLIPLIMPVDTPLCDKKETIKLHMSLGMWIRNNWGLWGGSRLQKYLFDISDHPDGMSSIILEYYYDWLHKK